MKDKLRAYILQSSFPCIMAKAVARTGNLSTLRVKNLDESNVGYFLKNIYQFIDILHQNKTQLSSFVLLIDNQIEFKVFEKKFWQFLELINAQDKQTYIADPRVNSNPRDGRFSFSIKSEAFFIIALHPQSPRKARRFPFPAIVFNPHEQFENMKRNGVFKKIRDLIRFKDKILQGTINPMLQDFGTRSEVFQYLGRIYSANSPIPLHF